MYFLAVEALHRFLKISLILLLVKIYYITFIALVLLFIHVHIRHVHISPLIAVSLMMVVVLSLKSFLVSWLAIISHCISPMAISIRMYPNDTAYALSYSSTNWMATETESNRWYDTSSRVLNLNPRKNSTNSSYSVISRIWEHYFDIFRRNSFGRRNSSAGGHAIGLSALLGGQTAQILFWVFFQIRSATQVLHS